MKPLGDLRPGAGRLPADRGEGTGASLLRWQDVAQLAATSGYPCVSVLMPTTPGERMSEGDIARLATLVGEVRKSLGSLGLLSGSRLLADLEELAARAGSAPTGRGLALYVSRAVQRLISVPVPVEERAVIEPTFATRDLVRALHMTPPHLLVTLVSGRATIHRAQGGTLLPASRIVAARTDRAKQADTGVTRSTEAFLREIDHALAEARRAFPGPLVLAGTAALIDTFCSMSRHLDRLAGRLDLRDAPTLPDLQRHAALALERYMLSRQQEALDLVARLQATRSERLVSGIEGAWLAARRHRPLLLAVEQGYTLPGHHSGSPLRSATGGPDDPAQVHDLVDDLIEIVILRGGWVALTDDGALAEHQRLALVLRQ